MAPSIQTDGTYAALLRGINVGGKNKLPMKDLVEIFEKLGCTDVQTYIQSGNVVFRAANLIARDLPAQASVLIQTKFCYQVPVVLRTGSAFLNAVESNPFFQDGIDPKTLHVAFLSEEPTPAVISSLDPNRSPGDRFAVKGREIYLHCPNGLARTKLTNQYFDTKLGTTSTIRNWKTVNRLLEMLS